jgi:hypothetical protein
MRCLKKPPTDLWEKVARECEYATFFHTPTWARIIEKSLPCFRIGTKAYILEDGTNVILPLMVRGLPYRKKYCSMVPGVYGGPIAGRKLTTSEVDLIFSDLCRLGVSRIDVTGNPMIDFSLSANYRCREDFTHILDLDKGFDGICKGFAGGNKGRARKAARMGVEVTVANSLEDYQEYYKVYQDSLRRWGKGATSSYSFELFRNIFEAKNSDIRLWIASVKGRTVAGVLVLYCNNHAVYWHGSSLEEYFEYCASNLLHVEIIKDTCNKGYRYYDFNPSGGHEGVAKFKKSFGAEQRRILRWQWEPKLIRILKKVQRNQRPR